MRRLLVTTSVLVLAMAVAPVAQTTERHGDARRGSGLLPGHPPGCRRLRLARPQDRRDLPQLPSRRLINYALTRLAPADTASIVGQLQHVDANQQWVSGVRARRWYTLSVMDDLGGEAGYDNGVATTTRLAEPLLAGRENA